MKLQDMRVTDAEKKQREVKLAERVDGDTGPDYPWGLTVSLDEHVLRKLGIVEMPKPGEIMHLEGIAKVSGVRQESHDGGEEARHVELQIMHLGLGGADETKEESAAKIFDGAGKRKTAAAA